MLEQRQHLVDERRKAAIATKLQKESIAKMMEEVRTNASKANKIIGKAMSGQMSLESLLSTNSSPARSKSSSGSRPRKTKGVSADSVGLGRSMSAGNTTDYEQTFENEYGGSEKLKYSMPEIPKNKQPQQYVSPYEPMGNTI
jgi:hypothetical protein